MSIPECCASLHLTRHSVQPVRPFWGLGVQAWPAHTYLLPPFTASTPSTVPPAPSRALLLPAPSSAQWTPTCLPRPRHSSMTLRSHPCSPDSSCLLLWVCFHVTLGTDYRPLSLSVPKSVSPPREYGSAWEQVHVWSPWSAQATPTCVCGAQGRGHAGIWDAPAWGKVCLHGQVSHRCLWGSKSGVSGVWVSLGG